ncbi:MAG: hypothetical protein QOG00_2883 [Pyrinomonadaceae bacterium]|nr:hypothetical protein [Pyrinomonadaceae bacterium]
MKTKFLWIEDNANTSLSYLMMPIYNSGKYDPVIALSVADGLHRLWQTEFAAVVLDIRLPPGNDPQWAKLYNLSGHNRGAAQLGLALLVALLRPQEGTIDLGNRPAWLKPDKIKPEKFGVLSVESEPEVTNKLEELGISVRQEKTAHTTPNTLLDMVNQIMQNAAPRGGLR